MKSRSLMVALIAVATLMCIALLGSCGSKPTLEQYYNDNPEEWSEIEDAVKNTAGEMFAMTMSVEGNKISQIMTYTETFPEDSAAEMKEYFTDQESALREKIGTSIAKIETQTGIEGISWLMQYNNGDGTELFSITIDSSDAGDTAAADTSAAVEETAATEEETSAAA